MRDYEHGYQDGYRSGIKDGLALAKALITMGVDEEDARDFTKKKEGK